MQKNSQKALANSSLYLSPKHSDLRPVPQKNLPHHPTPTSVGVLPATSLLQHGIFKVPNPIGSMGGLVYLPTFTHKNQPNVGQSTVRPMDPYGLSTKNSRLNLSCFFLKRF